LVLLSHKLNLDRATSPVPATSNRPRRLGFPLWENRRDGYSIIDRRYRLCRPAMRYNYRPPLLAAVEGLELIPGLYSNVPSFIANGGHTFPNYADDMIEWVFVPAVFDSA
jgi:hypothetical protein